MDEIQIFALVVTIAIGLLVVAQVVFLLALTLVLTRVARTIRNVKQTTEMSKEFVSALRQEQMRNGPLWLLGWFAFKKAQFMRNK